MKHYLLSGNKSFAEACPFSVTYISTEQLQLPKTHLLFVTADSTCFVDVASKIPVAYLPTVNKVVRIVPILPENYYDSSILEQLIHMYPDNAPALRRSFMFGEDSFRACIEGLNEMYQWQESIEAQLGGLRCPA